MGRYLMTHSLLSSWLYTMKGNPYEDRVLDAIQQARSALFRMKMLVLRNADEPEDTADAE